MTNAQVVIRDKVRNLNLQINQQIKRSGKTLAEAPESEWKTWVLELIKMRDELEAVELYKAIASGKVEGMQIKKRIIKVGSITFIPS